MAICRPRGRVGVAPGPAAAVTILLHLLFIPASHCQDKLADEGLRHIEAMEAAFRRAIDRVRPSVVSISLRDARLAEQIGVMDPRFFRNRRAMTSGEMTAPAGFGTGIVLRKEGIVLTCYHVVRSSVSPGSGLDVYVQLPDGSEYPASVYAADPRSDLASLRLRSERPLNLTPITIGDGSNLLPGQFVLAVGNPFGVASPDGATSASWGIISNVRRRPATSGFGASGQPTIEMQGRTLVQTDARLNMGSSGAALINVRGELVGIGMALAAAVGFEAPGGFAQPTDALTRRTLETLAEGKEVEYGMIGIRFEPYEGVDASGRPSRGVLVAKVELPAARQAGLEDQDIIVEVNGTPIRDQHDLVLLVGSLPPGAKLHTKVLHGATIRDLVIPLGKFRVDEEPIVTNKRPEWNGIRVDYLSVMVSMSGGSGSLPDTGVVVREVRGGSPADQKGIRQGQVIVAVNGVKVSDPDQFDELVSRATGPVRLALGDDVEKLFEPMSPLK